MSEELLTSQEKDVLGEISNISMGSAATALSGLLGKRVEITVPRVEVVSSQEMDAFFPEEHIMVKVLYAEGLRGSNILLIKNEDAKAMVSLMMGGDGKSDLPQEIDELGISALGEAMNQMMGSASTALSDFLGLRVSISPPEVVFENVSEAERRWVEEQGEESLVAITFRLVVEDVIDSSMIQLVPLSLAKEVVSSLLPGEEVVVPEETSEEEEKAELESGGAEETGAREEEQPLQKKSKPTVEAKKVEFAEFKKREEAAEKINLELLMDVSLPVIVELGRTRLAISEILDLGPGSIIELDKLAGEPADLYVNDVLFARGEVVVIEENFGVRITEIIKPEERIKSLKEARAQ
ncbi:MAG: flagellar motor switch protein FliN [Candidatus Atribacteria bacterium]|jgi:flagellar motor switch protein FliN/FliY|nr:flagellar motor switch protein FliN [Candidatus Atribacteria bacterium]